MTIKKLIRFSGILLGVAVVVLIIALTELSESEHIIRVAQEKRSVSIALADELQESSRSLTSAVQKYVVTGNEAYADSYMDIILIRSGKMPRPHDRQIAPGMLVSLDELMLEADYSQQERDLLRQSALLSDELTALEFEAINAVRGQYSINGRPNQEKAVALIFSKEYEQKVDEIMAPLTLFRQMLAERLDATVAGANAQHGLAIRMMWVIFIILTAMFIAFLLLVNAVIVRPVLLCDMFAKQVADGNYDSRLSYTSGHEIGSLAESLRLMLRSMLERINLEENMRYFNAVISSVDAGVIIKDTDGLITDWNAGAEAILGYKPDDVIGHNTKYYAPEDGHAAIDEIAEQLRRGVHIAHVEVVRKHIDGRLIDCSASYTPIFNDNGDFDGSVAIFHDITEKKAAEQKAKRFSAIAAIADAGIVVKDSDGTVLEWNIGAENLLGYKAQEIIGHTSKRYAPEEGHANIEAIEKRLKNGEHIAHVEVVRKHKDGRLIDCSASYTPIYDDIGSFTGSVSIFHDVTAEKKAINNAKHMAAIVSASDAGIIIKDADCNIVEWNLGSEKILGYKAEEVIGKNTKYYVPEEYYAELDEIKARLLRGEHTVHLEVVRRHKNGHLVDCSATYTPVFDDKKRYIGSVTVFQDISEKKQIEYALKEAVHAAEEASKTKSSFLANMSHEIRTPMNGVIGFTELALDDAEISDAVRDYLNKIKSSASNLLGIINDILDISKIEAGAMQLEKIPFSLHDVFNECEYISLPKAKEKGISLYFYAEPFIGGRLIGDPTRLRQILLNLLSNAIKFTNLGMVKLTSTVVEEEDNNVKISFEVRDSGIGMTSEQIRLIFDPFAQADSSTTRKYGGTGLGLSITKSFVEMMGGRLNVDSSPGLGSKFSFELVFETISEAVIEESTKKDVPSAHNKPAFMGTVLVCEDNSINQEVIVKQLSRVGLSSVLAPNGRHGLDEVRKRMDAGKPFDLILMDIHMPVMDGLEATKCMLEMGCKTPIIALTANAMATDKEAYLAQGMSDYLSKPFTSEEMWVCLARNLSPSGYVENPEAVSENRDTQKDGGGILNEAEGIEISAGDERLYKRVKRNFYKDNLDVLSRLNKALADGDIELAYRTAHTLKGTAALIGAGKLSKAAAVVEKSLANEIPENLAEQIKPLENALMEVLSVLEPVSHEPEDAEKADAFDKNNALALIDELIPLLASGDPESAGYVTKIKRALKPLGGDCDTLLNQIEDFDFDMAHRTIQAMKQKLNG